MNDNMIEYMKHMLTKGVIRNDPLKLVRSEHEEELKDLADLKASLRKNRILDMNKRMADYYNIKMEELPHQRGAQEVMHKHAQWLK